MLFGGAKMKKINWDSRIVQFNELVIDVLIVIASLLLVMYTFTLFDYMDIDFFDFKNFDFDLLLLILGGVSLLIFRVYNVSLTRNGYFDVIKKILISLIIINFAFGFVLYFIVSIDIPLTILIYSFILQVVFFTAYKKIFFAFMKKVNIKDVLIFGIESQVDDLFKKMMLGSERYINVKYLVYEKDQDCDSQLKEVYNLINYVDNVYLTANLSEHKKNTIIQFCIEKGKKFYLVPKIYELAIINARIDQIGDVLAYEVTRLELSLEDKFIKRVFDILVSLIGIIITSPIMLFFGLLIKISDRGPIFFKQERLTYKNKKFTLIKLRTMVANAEKNTGPIFASENDPRVTKLGNFLRKTRIDELPQFFNILKGDMSLVGPRPEREFFVEQFKKEKPDYVFRMNAKAGVTGLAQALGKYNTSFEDKLRFDLYYIRNYSIFQDIYILFHTIKAVFDEDSSQGLSTDLELGELMDKMERKITTENEEQGIYRVYQK